MLSDYSIISLPDVEKTRQKAIAFSHRTEEVGVRYVEFMLDENEYEYEYVYVSISCEWLEDVCIK